MSVAVRPLLRAAIVPVVTWCRAHARGLRLGAAVAGLVLLALMIRQAGVGRIASGLVAIGPWYLVVIGVSAAWAVLNAWAWSLAVRPARPSLSSLVCAQLAAEAVNNLTPFMSLGGEPLKVLWLEKTAGRETAAASVVADNIVHAASAPVFMAMGLLLGRWAFDLDGRLVAWLVAGIGLVAAVAWGLLRASAGGVVAAIARLAVRAAETSRPGPAGTDDASAVEGAKRADAIIRRFLRARDWRVWASLAGHLGGRLLGAVEAWIILLALGTPIPLAGAVFVIAIAHALVNLVFAVVPSQLGVQEATAYTLFGAVGLDPAAAVALMLARRVRGFFWNGVGLVLLARGAGRSPRPPR